MKNVELKPALILLVFAALVGLAIQYFTGFSWLTAALIIIIALLINGLAIFFEDIDKGGLDYQEGITDTEEARRRQKKIMRIQGAIIILLVILAILSYVFIEL